MLDAADNASPVDAVEAVTRELGLKLAASSISLLIADLSGRALVRLAHVPFDADDDADGGRRIAVEESATVLPFDGGEREQVMRSQQAQVVAPHQGGGGRGGTWTVLAPVTQRGETLGLLEVALRVQPEARALEAIRRAAFVLGFVLVANRRHTDLFEWGQRTRPFSLSAEIQRRLLPAAFTCEAAAFTLSAWLEPAASVGGDTFDYSLDRDVLHLSMTDAMGHGVPSALTATLCLGALRSARRSGMSLLEQADHANSALLEHSESVDVEAFVTGLIGRLDLTSGDLALINAGHVAPYLAREGSVAALELPGGLPLGLFGDATFGSTVIPLRAGDRLVMVTDGMLERNAAAFDITEGIGDTRALHPREAVRYLADAILAKAGHELTDDATLLVLDWNGDHLTERVATAGSQIAHTSEALDGVRTDQG